MICLSLIMSVRNRHNPNIPTLTVSIVVSGQVKTVKGWSQLQWNIDSVLSDPDGPDKLSGPIPVRESENFSQYLWKGLQIELYKDAGEGYWYNLLSEVPYAFVVFAQDEVDEEAVPIPFLITVSQDEAGAHLETDCMVLSAPLPANLRDTIEKFVVENYVPEERKKRKRKNWVEDSIRNNQ